MIIAIVTNTYRQAIGGNLVDLDEAIHRIKTVFGRKTTHAYLLEKMTIERQAKYPISPLPFD